MKCICRTLRLGAALFTALVAAALIGPAAWAHVDPAGATESGVGQRIGIFEDAACGTPLDVPIVECETVYVRATLVWTGLPGSSFEQGRWRLLANGTEFADITPAGGVPCIGDPVNSADDPNLPGGRGNCAGAPSEFPSACVAYTPTAGDIAALGINFQAVWGDVNPNSPDTGYTHRSANDNAGANSSIAEFTGIEVCDDGSLCTIDTCSDETDECIFTPVNCDDGVGCTVDSCDEATGECINSPDDTLCDDGEFCNGVEFCDPVNDCQAGTPPDCNDGVACTDDSCDEVNDQCVNEVNDANCDDGEFCNGVEFCDPVNDCQAGTPPDCNDGVLCTDDSCDEVNDQCVNAPNDGNCDDGQFCNGVEFCDPIADCQAGTPPDCNDDVDCTNDRCDEDNDQCVSTPDDTFCDDGNSCTDDACDPATGPGSGCVNDCAPEGKDECELIIGDFIWEDTDNNGQQGGEEGNGLGDVTVDLVDCSGDPVVAGSTTTAADGSYLFTIGVNPDTCEFDSQNFKITVTDENGVLAGYDGSPQDQGDDTTDSDCNPNNRMTECTFFSDDDLTIDCGFFERGIVEICRTPGFWGTHAGTEKEKSQNITQQVIDAAGGTLYVCGESVENTLVDWQNSAVEAMCVSVQSESELQLARQLTAAALNCVQSDGAFLMPDNPCGGLSNEALFMECNELCTSGGEVSVPNGYSVSECIDRVDCWNNGGTWFEGEGCYTGTCPNGDLCYESDDCVADVAGSTTDVASSVLGGSGSFGTNSGASNLSYNNTAITTDHQVECTPFPGNCHNRQLCPLDENGQLMLDDPLCFEPPGPAGSRKACNQAIKNDCDIFGGCSNP